MSSLSEHQALQEVPPAELTWLRLNVMASTGHEHFLRHNLPHTDPARKAVTDQAKLQLINNLHSLHVQIVGHNGPLDAATKAAFIAQEGGARFINHADRNLVWEM